MLSRILLVTNEYPPEKIAGTAMFTQFLAEELASRDYRVVVVVNTRHTAPAREGNGTLEVIRLRPLGVPMTRMAQRVALLVNVARRTRPDVIHGQSLSCGFLALLAGRCLGIPAVTNVAGYDLYEAGKWARTTYIRWALQLSDAVVAYTADLQVKAYDLSGRRGEVIPLGLRMRDAHGVDRETARALLRLPREGKILLFVGRLVPNKGVGYLIRALPRVLARYPDARLVLVGDGQERRSLEALTRDLNLEGYVSFSGAQAHEDVIRYMRAAEIFVLPSLAEPFGIVLLEAMSCGLPIVASNVMGVPSIVEDITNGFLVPPADEVTLADRIVRLLDAPSQWAAIAQRNVQKAAAYAMPRITDRFLGLWEEAAMSRGTGRFPRRAGNG